MNHDRALGALLGTALGDALGMPVDGLSHQNVRTYYKGIKGYRADEHRRDLEAGQWTALTQRTFALARTLTAAASHGDVSGRYAADVAQLDLRRDGAAGPSAAIVAATPLGVWTARGSAADDDVFDLAAATFGAEHGGEALAAGVGHAFAVRTLFDHAPEALDGPAFLHAVTERTRHAEDRLGSGHAVSGRLRAAAGHLDDFPLDLQDLCGGTGAAADEAWPFAVAMLARNPTLLESNVLPAINVGGAASVIGACIGGLVGALHGWAAFPAEWREELEDVERLEAEAAAFAEALS
jgi:hypothetical protein